MLVVPAGAGAIYDGEPVPAEQTPWLVTFTGMGVSCGGALIAPDRVLTAAHCIQGVRPDRLHLRLGGGAWPAARRLPWRGAVFPVTYRAIPAPDALDDPRRAASLDDIAVVLLRAPVAGVEPLSPAGVAPAAGEEAVTIGHGRTGLAPAPSGPNTPDPGAPSVAARSARQTVQDDAVCAAAYGPALFHADHHLCTQDLTATAAQACAGDSGSPVLTSAGGALAVAGVVTWGGETRGRGCGEGLPDVSERALAHRDLLAATPAARALAPWAQRRVRVRRRGLVRRCVAGVWHPAGARLEVRWWRLGTPRTRRHPRTGATVTLPAPKTLLPGHGTTRVVRRGRVGCSVTARTAGGWATEDSYNQL